MERFSEELRRQAEPLWAAEREHPFIRGIADGTLEPERFRHFIRQDWLFLVQYGRVLALASARAPRLDWQRRFARLAVETLDAELSLHREYAAAWGISEAELDAERPTAATRSYTDSLLRAAAVEDFAELSAALLPCMWGYSWLGRELAAAPRPAGSPYVSWIEAYASEEFAELADWCREIVDALAAGLGEEGRERMREAFLESSRHELAFWESAWRLEPPA